MRCYGNCFQKEMGVALNRNKTEILNEKKRVNRAANWSRRIKYSYHYVCNILLTTIIWFCAFTGN